MPVPRGPSLPDGWVYFADLLDLGVAIISILLITLMIIWWRQQTRAWFRVAASTFLAALLLCIGSYYLFVVPPYVASCPPGCTGWRGFPVPIALITRDGVSRVALFDFLLNLIMLWLLWLGATLVWRLLATIMRWENRTWRSKTLFFVFLVILPWALIPRILAPPQPQANGEDLRLAVNARRSAEFTYGITGLWIQRLALEDVRQGAPIANPESLFGATVANEVCLRGYTYFYLPWRRYRITLDPSGVTALNLSEAPLEGSCWEDLLPPS
jgi:hypothetical protein